MRLDRTGNVIPRGEYAACSAQGETAQADRQIPMREIFCPHHKEGGRLGSMSKLALGSLGDPHPELTAAKIAEERHHRYIKWFDQRINCLLGIFERGTRAHIGIIRIDLDYAATEATAVRRDAAIR